MISVSTKSGFKAEIDERALKDWRFTQALVKTQKGSDYDKLEGANAIADLLMGPENVSALCDHIAKANDGFVPTDIFMAELSEVILSVKQTKN